MVDRYGSQFVRCSREVLSLKSEEWNHRSSNKDRLSSYLFFLRGRGLQLLQLFQEEQESIAGKIGGYSQDTDTPNLRYEK